MNIDNNGPVSDNQKRTNFESFDVWGKAQFAMWSHIRYDFELINELLIYLKSTQSSLNLLNSVNKYVKNAPEQVFFDGTIKCLKYLIKNNYLILSELPTITNEEKHLVKLLKKYSERLDIVDIISDIEEPILRAMFLEYPNLIGEMLKNNPLIRHLVSKALLKNGVTDINSFESQIDNSLNSIEVSTDKNSKESMGLKIIYLGLLILNNKISLTSDTATEFRKITDNSAELDIYARTMFNATYSAFYGNSLWNEEKKTHLSGCDNLYLDFQLLFLPKNHMSMTYDLFLSEEVDKIGIKYFGNKYSPKNFIASLAIKMAICIVLYRASDFIPKDEKKDVSIYDSCFMLRTLNYALKETDDPEKPLRLKEWFVSYFCNELDKRIAFIKMQVENNVAIIEMSEKQRVVYLPVFESFRFFCQRDTQLEQIISMLKNRNIPNTIKDDIFINFVINIQKIIIQKEVPEDEQRLKNTFLLLIIQTFEGLSKKIAKEMKVYSKKYYEEKDLISDASLSIIELILKFDLSKCDSFIGYLASNLKWKMKTSGRMNKTEENTDTEINFEADFLNNIPDAVDIVASLDNQRTLEIIKNIVEKLPEKEKLAVKKLVETNEKFSDTERKAKNRGLNKIREMMNIS